MRPDRVSIGMYSSVPRAWSWRCMPAPVHGHAKTLASSTGAKPDRVLSGRLVNGTVPQGVTMVQSWPYCVMRRSQRAYRV